MDIVNAESGIETVVIEHDTMISPLGVLHCYIYMYMSQTFQVST